MKLTLLLASYSLLAAPTFAQQKQESYQIPRFYFLAGGIGLGLLDYEYNLGIGYRDHATIFGVHVLRSASIKGLEIGPLGGGTTHFKRPMESITEAYAYIGRTAYDQRFQATATIGLGFSTGIVRGDFLYNDGSHDNFETLHVAHIALPVDGQIAYVPSNRYAIILGYHASFNAVKIYRGFIFGLQYTFY